MKGMSKAIWLGSVLGLVAVFIGVLVIFRDTPGWGLVFVLVISFFVGLLICLPVAGAVSGGLMSKLFAINKGKISKDYSRAKRALVEDRFEEAIEEFRRALEEEPENLSLRLEIAEIYSRDLYDYRKAIEEYEEALNMEMMDSERASILNRIADMYESGLGDEEMAVRTLSRIVEALPGTKFGEKATERMERIRRERRSGRDVTKSSDS